MYLKTLEHCHHPSVFLLLFPGVKRMENEGDHSPLYRVRYQLEDLGADGRLVLK
jgi:hypothetical protein